MMLTDWAFHNKQQGGKAHLYRIDGKNLLRLCDDLRICVGTGFSNIVSAASAPHCKRCEAKGGHDA